jgi:hypothetical protein
MKIRRFWPESAKHLLAQHLGLKMITKIADEPGYASKAANLFFKSGRGARPHLQCRVTRPGPAKWFCPNPPEVRQIVMPDGHEIKLGGETGEA